MSETADTVRPGQLDRNSVEFVNTPGWQAKPNSELDEKFERLMNRMAELDGKLEFLVSQDSARQQYHRQLDRLGVQMGAIATYVQTSIAERDEGNGLGGISVFIAEDDPGLGPTWERMLANRGCYPVSLATTYEQAKATVETVSVDQAPSHAIFDVKLGGGYGVDIARLARDRWPHTAILLTTGFTDESFPVGVGDASFVKPIGNDELANLLRQTRRR